MGSSPFTRRAFLKAASAAATYFVLTNAVGCDFLGRGSEEPRAGRGSKEPPPGGSSARAAEDVWEFRSRPDLRPPIVEVDSRADNLAPGYIFVAPEKSGARQAGAMILDERGEVVWFHPLEGARVQDFKAQTYRGRPVLTWKENPGEYVIFDDSYREITRFTAGADAHEFLISPQDTALVTIYNDVDSDLSSFGGPEDGVAHEGVVQELDIATGEVLFEWHSLDHIGLDETYSEPSQTNRGGLDYFHINSIDVDYDDNLLISARGTSGVYKIDRESGEVFWRLGGKRSDFEMGEGTRFSYQHDARRQEDGTITIFDNGDTVFENKLPRVVEQSRGITLDLDEDEMTATLVREYTHPDKRYADAAANMQTLDNGNVFVGWGRAQAFSEFSEDGDLLFDARLPSNSYRAFRFPWSAQPNEKPAAAAERASEEEVRVYASYNGATEVATWEVLAGSRPDQLQSVGSFPRDGFETPMSVQTPEPYIAVRARERSDRSLGVSEPVEL